MSRISKLHLLALLLWFPAEGLFAQVSLGLLPTQRAERREPGERHTFVCPAGTGANTNVYGTDVYTADSAVCPAAIHAGRLSPNEAGVVTIISGTGAKVFRGSTRNGVTTQNYGAWPYSFTFVDDGEPGSINWRTTWSQIPADFSEPMALVCPPGGQVGVIWGTGVYSRDSSICTAAVHAGFIKPDKGGTITVSRATNTVTFAASDKFGVKSMASSAEPDAFKVSPASMAPAASIAPATTSAPAPVQSANTCIPSSPAATQPQTALDRASPNLSGKQITLRSTEPLSITVVEGEDVLISWPAVSGAAYYGVAGYTETLWRQVQAPTTAVVYKSLGAGEYTFAVGAYFEPGPVSTPIAEWQRVKVKVMSQAEARRITDALNKSAESNKTTLDALTLH